MTVIAVAFFLALAHASSANLLGSAGKQVHTAITLSTPRVANAAVNVTDARARRQESTLKIPLIWTTTSSATGEPTGISFTGATAVTGSACAWKKAEGSTCEISYSGSPSTIPVEVSYSGTNPLGGTGAVAVSADTSNRAEVFISTVEGTDNSQTSILSLGVDDNGPFGFINVATTSSASTSKTYNFYVCDDSWSDCLHLNSVSPADNLGFGNAYTLSLMSSSSSHDGQCVYATSASVSTGADIKNDATKIGVGEFKYIADGVSTSEDYRVYAVCGEGKSCFDATSACTSGSAAVTAVSLIVTVVCSVATAITVV